MKTYQPSSISRETTTPVILILYYMDAVLSDARTARVAVDPKSPDDDRYWKWGDLYVNPEDPRIIVPKRAGWGETINLGHPLGKLIAISTLGLLVGLCLLPALIG
ncbi:DUF5808 domain-containing protein [Austwickia chelonae]|uniref:DUF5808 domain-containing protein n=1 Tax=Austwickia chelonae TaxID=100225 RepID=UPI000E23D1BD|nr:DUF5808 domain-containing protein [Austwickia chelonae]